MEPHVVWGLSMVGSHGDAGQVPGGAVLGGVAGAEGALRSESNGQLAGAVDGGGWDVGASGGKVRPPVGAQLGQ